MFGNLGNFAAFVKSAQEMQKRVADVQEVLKAAKVEGSAGCDLVRVTANGKGDIERISIDPSLLKPEEKEAL
ncbi:MAG TPA: YbaB/EbfC family nucleoid-associated protein, partial [Candidatus Latescibacteria bacterium]|nr:YbaB/EbfC family nucleoid-associated protein [Candidatus Latescibacterota bacterium]